jgi:hypothetical protein
VNGNHLRFLTLTPTLSHRERELKEVAINGRSKYILDILRFDLRGSGQGRNEVETGGAAALRRGFQNRENTGLGQKMPFPDGHALCLA